MRRLLLVPALFLLLLGFVAGPSPAADDKKENEEVAAVVKQLRSKKAADRTAGIEAAAKLGDKAKAAFRPLCEIALLGPDSKLGQAAMEAMEKVNGDLAAKVQTVIVDREPQKKRKAILEIGAMGEEGAGAIPVVIAFVGTYKTFSQDWVVEGLDVLLAIGPEDPDTFKALGNASDLNGGFVRQNGNSTTMGAEVAKRLSQYATDHEKAKKQVVAALLPITRSRDEASRIEAAKALGGLGADAKIALASLKALKSDPVEEVRKAAKEAIEAIEAK